MTKRNDGRWTESRYRNFIRSALRRASVRWPPRTLALEQAFVSRKKNKKTGRMAKHYRCNKCKKLFVSKEVEVNHINPIVPVTGFDTWDGLIERLFCEKEGLEVLCKPCHRAQTKEENEERKRYK